MSDWDAMCGYFICVTHGVAQQVVRMRLVVHNWYAREKTQALYVDTRLPDALAMKNHGARGYNSDSPAFCGGESRMTTDGITKAHHGLKVTIWVW